MRPDKKKVRHHDSRKKAEAAKQKLAAAEKSNNNSSRKAAGSNPLADHEKGENRRSRRVLESTWQEYSPPEMPPGSDDEGASDNEDLMTSQMTGLDFDYVIENRVGSDAMLRTKLEREWEEKQQTFNTEYFALDLNNLEKAISCIPLHKQLDVPPENLNEETLATFERTATAAQKSYASRFTSCDGAADAAAAINSKLLAALKITSTERDNHDVHQQQQLQTPKPIAQQKSTFSAGQEFSSPKKPDESSLQPEAADVALKASSSDDHQQSARKSDPENLEDWLDDFLG